MGAFLKEFKTEARSPVPWVLWLTMSLVTALSGPFGTYGALDVAGRVALWSPVIALAVLAATVVRAFLLGVLHLPYDMRASFLAAALNAMLIAPVIYLVMARVLPDSLDRMLNLGEVVLLIVSISLGVCALRISAPGPAAAAKDEPPAAPQVHMPRLMRRLDPSLRAEIWAITVRDHYVDVQTAVGKASLLMRFSDAMDEVDCQPGAQVHRSHWVAWAGVGSVCREGGKMILHLRNGHQIPVSRNHRKTVDARFPPLPPMPPATSVAA